MSVLVHLVRHGEVENPEGLVYGDLPGFGLSARGRRQAQAAAQRLRLRPIVAVWSSPLERALRTAELIARHHQLPVRVEEELIEWRHDTWIGLPWDRLPELRPGELEAYLADPTDLSFVRESLADLAARVAGAIMAAIASGNGEAVVVGHQDPLQSARLLLTGTDLHRLHLDAPQHASIITLQPGDPWTEVERWQPE